MPTPQPTRLTPAENSSQRKTLMPAHSELTMGLAHDAFKLLGEAEFTVTATLSAENPDTLRNFGRFESVLLMAYRRGQADVSPAAAANVLEVKFNPSGWQWEEAGKAHQLEDLSRDDLLQVACSCIAVLEQVDGKQAALAQLMQDWRSGDVRAEEISNGVLA